MTSQLDAYDYKLPRDLIAQEPLPCRSDARLMVVDRQASSIEHRYVRDLPELLRRGDHLVLNDTRVVRASLIGHRTETGGRWQGLFLSCSEEGHWRILSKTRGKIKPGETITLIDREARDNVRLRLLEKCDEGVWLAHPEPEEEAFALLDRVGRVPLPHYIRGGHMIDTDLKNYQTVYARRPGAVAAPTAGLHFTEGLLKEIVHRGVEATRVTLHVGLDTFKPITADSLDRHTMHSEWAQLSPSSVERIERSRAQGGRIVAVGTTTVRVLETAAGGDRLEPWEGPTDLFIRPPYAFRVVDSLLTNFHLPRTTLLVLVRTFGGDELMRRAYDEAIREEYRFYSYGDAMLIV